MMDAPTAIVSADAKSEMASQKLIRQPYVGPRPFELWDEQLFFGRDNEASEILSLITAHRVFLVYAQSGAGKTSLLNAKLVPNLIRRGFDVLPVARVQGGISHEVALDDVTNIFAFNVLKGWSQQSDVGPQELVQMRLAEFFTRRRSHQRFPLPCIVAFDQFEELFTSQAERWKDREGFFEQSAVALEKDELLRIVFLMREDYIAELTPYVSFLPDRLRARFRLERLGLKAALLAIKNPIKDTGYRFSSGVAKTLVRNLSEVRVKTAAGTTVEIPGQFVEPVQLQVVCLRLWESLRADEKLITSDHVLRAGNVNLALAEFYEVSLKKAVRRPA